MPADPAESSPEHDSVERDLSRLVVAIDGPSGAGKSTVSRAVAARLGLRYLDTGAMYRAMTWGVLAAGIDPSDGPGVTTLVRAAQLEIGTDPAAPTVRLDGRDVAVDIRSAAVSAAVSAVSAVPDVRRLLVERQQTLIGSGGIVVEGRDIGTVVAPRAAVKIFLTASSTARAKRRAGQRSGGADVSVVQQAIERRDRLDSTRTTSPLVRADDAVELDTTTMTRDEVVAAVLDRCLAVDAGSGTPR
ncbi:MAG: (d)CMP kinase [Mycobacteriales bacterium]